MRVIIAESYLGNDCASQGFPVENAAQRQGHVALADHDEHRPFHVTLLALPAWPQQLPPQTAVAPLQPCGPPHGLPSPCASPEVCVCACECACVSVCIGVCVCVCARACVLAL